MEQIFICEKGHISIVWSRIVEPLDFGSTHVEVARAVALAGVELHNLKNTSVGVLKVKMVIINLINNVVDIGEVAGPVVWDVSGVVTYIAVNNRRCRWPVRRMIRTCRITCWVQSWPPAWNSLCRFLCSLLLLGGTVALLADLFWRSVLFESSRIKRSRLWNLTHVAHWILIIVAESLSSLVGWDQGVWNFGWDPAHITCRILIRRLNDRRLTWPVFAISGVEWHCRWYLTHFLPFWRRLISSAISLIISERTAWRLVFEEGRQVRSDFLGLLRV